MSGRENRYVYLGMGRELMWTWFDGCPRASLSLVAAGPGGSPMWNPRDRWTWFDGECLVRRDQVRSAWEGRLDWQTGRLGTT